MITSNTTSRNVAAYYIVQHVPDLFRRECRNVGVIVERNGEVAARFFGERSPGDIDGRLIRWIESPDVYRQWVGFWRKTIQKFRGKDELGERLGRPNGEYYNVIHGGFLDGTAGDSIEAVCSYAYAMLVSEGGLVEAFGKAKDESPALKDLRDDMRAAFKELEILSGTASLFLKHPVLADSYILGATAEHQFSFAQRDKHWWVIEPVNFVTRQKSLAKDHAGWMAFAFADVQEKHQSLVKPIAVARYTESDLDDPIVDYSLSLLTNVARVVNWMDQREQTEFLEERRSIAVGA